jgi:hypothetical protein
MPEENSEQAVPGGELTAPFGTSRGDSVAPSEEADFPVVLRGYDRLAVDAYVKTTSRQLQAARSPEVAVKRALEQLGDEVSGILQQAHDTAADVIAQARAEAWRIVEQAREEATSITAGAQTRLKDLDTDTDRIWAERHRIVGDTRELARQLFDLATSAADRFPPAEDAEVVEEVEVEGQPEAEGGIEPFDADLVDPSTEVPPIPTTELSEPNEPADPLTEPEDDPTQVIPPWIQGNDSDQ